MRIEIYGNKVDFLEKHKKKIDEVIELSEDFPDFIFFCAAKGLILLIDPLLEYHAVEGIIV